MFFEFCPPGPSDTEVGLRQREDLVVIPWKIVSSISREELGVRCQLIFVCPQKFCNMKLLLQLKATNSLVACYGLVDGGYCRPSPFRKPPSGYMLDDCYIHGLESAIRKDYRLAEVISWI
ncbi:hypothetical protein Acr_16g0000720 [Actinidia rufa]|uniref:Uncharacterized protein n=1 Tax=Actinidia rufa TaxID=165716 RepID=A0A7J0FZU8_9ERIC|nr:hypothetical protein Acr_16g0000720 [Actinidia rufa]